MQIDTKIIKKHFQKSLDTYNDNAVIQKITAQKMSDMILGNFYNSILEIGSGAGLLTEQISKKCTFKKYSANDLVEKSKIYVEKFVSDADFFAGDFRNINFHKKYDLIISNAVFQWFENIDKVLNKCANLMQKNGTLLFSTFSPENFKEFKSVSGISLNYKTVKELEIVINKYFEISTVEQFEHQLSFDNPLKILSHMKKTGVNSLGKNKWGYKEVKDFCDKYRKIYPKLTLTYSPIIIEAKLK